MTNTSVSIRRTRRWSGFVHVYLISGLPETTFVPMMNRFTTLFPSLQYIYQQTSRVNRFYDFLILQKFSIIIFGAKILTKIHTLIWSTYSGSRKNILEKTMNSSRKCNSLSCIANQHSVMLEFIISKNFM